MKDLTDAEIKVANLKHALFLKARIHDSKAVANYVNSLNKAGK